MKNRYIALKIYNNADWLTILEKLENRGYLWASRHKPTKLYQNCNQGSLFIAPNERVITMSARLDVGSDSCGCYIVVR